jgi:hypothetical protein
MNTNLKHMFYSLALAAIICATPSMASAPAPDPSVEVIGGGVTANAAPPAAVVVPPVDPAVGAPAGAGGLVEVPANAPVIPANFAPTAEDMASIQNIVNLLKSVYDEYNKQIQAGGKPDVNQIINAVFAKGGLGTQALDVVDDLTQKINGIIQANPAVAGTRKAKAQACCTKFASGLNKTSKVLEDQYFPLVQKYFFFFQHEMAIQPPVSPVQLIQDLIQEGMLADLHGLLTSTEAHHLNMKSAAIDGKRAAVARKSRLPKKGDAPQTQINLN